MSTTKLIQGTAGAALGLMIAGPSVWAEPLGPAAVGSLHEKIASIVDSPTPEEPFYITAEVRNHVESSEAALYFPQSVEQIAESLQSAHSWCEILPLHINVKACTYSPDGDELTIYMGKKVYEDPEDAYELTYKFRTTIEDGYFNAVAVAEDGPLGTSDYHIDFEVIEAGGRSFARLHLSDHQSWASSKAMQVYLHTKGKDKQGISVVDHDRQGNPVYSDGMQGVAERNVLRYYFAFAAYFDSVGVADDAERHAKQLDYWFDQTEKYPQLHELDKATYIQEKKHERRNQQALQTRAL